MALARNCIWISITDAASARQSASVELERSAEHLQAVKLTNADGLGELHLQISVQAISMHTAVKQQKTSTNIPVSSHMIEGSSQACMSSLCFDACDT